MSWEITKLDIAQVENSWYFQEPFDVIEGVTTYNLVYNPLEDSESVYLNRTFQYQDVEYLMEGNKLVVLVPINIGDKLYIQYATKDEINRFYILTDELGNPIWIDAVTNEPILL